MRRKSSFLVLVLLAAGCEQSFAPLAEPDGVFSLFGVLDLDADTQWVRVTAIRDTIFTHPDPIDAVVRLEHVATGRVVEMRDSLMRYPAEQPGLADHWAHNFWTTERIEPGTSYRVRATRSDGAETVATVDVPPRPERVGVRIDFARRARGPDVLRVDNAAHIAMVHLLRHAPPECNAPRERYSEFLDGAISAMDDGPASIVLRRFGFSSIPCGTLVTEEWTNLRSRPGPAAVQWWDLAVVVSGSPWPFDGTLPDYAISLGTLEANVENGTGFVGGIARIEAPYEYCEIPSATTDFHCTLVYDGDSAMLSGFVRLCEGEPAVRVPVAIVDPGEELVRPVFTDGRGYYRIGALRPSRDYRLTVQLEFDGVVILDEIVSLEPGERRERDVTLCAT